MGEAKLGERLVSEITRQDILRVIGLAREEGMHPKTVSRRLIVALISLRNATPISP